MSTSSPDTLTAADLPVRFGRYTLVSILGEGGMAKVFRAILEGPAGFRKPVALKVIKSQMSGRIEKEQRELFHREARLGGLLRHPHLVDVYELGEVDGTWYLAMEWIDGLTLFKAGQKGALPPSVLLSLGRALCGGLEDAHTLKVQGQRVGLVHRDLKPSNVLLGWMMARIYRGAPRAT
jgi:serine/threonine protein kinase